MSELKELLQRLAEEERTAAPSADVADRLAKAVRVRRRRNGWPWALAAAALLAFGLFVPRQETPPAEASPETVKTRTSEFFVLDPVRPIEDMRSGRLVRVMLPADAPSYFGLPPRSRSGPVEADVLLGDDGIARAVRFVR